MPQTEFFADTNRTIYMKDSSGIKELTMHDRDTVSSIMQDLEDKYPSKVKQMKAFFSKNAKNVPFFEFKIVKQFILCNFASNDPLTPDLDEDGNFHFEYYFCPVRGVCQMEGIFCHPQVETSLSQREMQVLSFLSKGNSINSIAGQLCLSRRTIERHIENMRAKLSLHTMPELIAWHNRTLQP